MGERVGDAERNSRKDETVDIRTSASVVGAGWLSATGMQEARHSGMSAERCGGRSAARRKEAMGM